MLRKNASPPVYGTAFSAGADLRACIDAPVTIAPGETVLIPTGIALEIPEGYAGLICARSGLATKMGLAPANKIGIIDSDYRGEILVSLFNHSSETHTVEHGDRICQLLIVPVLAPEFVQVTELNDTVRGKGGFGSTGKN